MSVSHTAECRGFVFPVRARGRVRGWLTLVDDSAPSTQGTLLARAHMPSALCWPLPNTYLGCTDPWHIPWMHRPMTHTLDAQTHATPFSVLSGPSNTAVAAEAALAASPPSPMVSTVTGLSGRASREHGWPTLNSGAPWPAAMSVTYASPSSDTQDTLHEV